MAFDDVAPVVDIVKDGPASIDEGGDSATYDITITNDSVSTDPLTIMSLNDDQFGDLLAEAVADWEAAGNTAPIYLLPGESFTFDIVRTLEFDVGDTHTNEVTVVAVDDEGTEATDNDDHTVAFDDVAPAINVTKTADQDQVFAPGEDVTFTVLIKNESVSTDPVTIDSLTDSIHGDLNGQGDCSVPQTIPAGSSYTCSFTVLVDDDETDVVTASGADDEGTPVSDSDDAYVEMINPSIDIEKSTNSFDADEAPGPEILIGYTVDWIYVVTNNGDVDLAGIVVTDDVLGPICTVNLAASEWTICTAIGTAEIGQYANTGTASASYTDADGDIADRSDSDPSHYWGATPSVDIAKTFDDDSVIAGGDPSSFTLVVTNDGNVDLDDVSVFDDVNDRLTVTNVSSTADCSASSGQTVDCTIASLVVGESVEITVDFVVDSAVEEANGAGGLNDEPSVGNAATASDTYIDDSSNSTTVGDQDSDTIDILVDINLSIVKTFDPDSLQQGHEGKFTLVVGNAGPSDAVGVEVTDMVEAELDVTGVTVTSGTGTCSFTQDTTTYLEPTNIACMVDIPDESSVTIEVTYIAAPAIPPAPEGPIFDPDLGTTVGGDEFRFVFVNGSVLEGSTTGLVYLNGVDITDQVVLTGDLTRNDILFDPPSGLPIEGVDDPAFLMHLSCSDRFIGGWGESDGPMEGVDVNWQIASYSITRYNNNGFIKACGDTPVRFNVPNAATASGTDSFESNPETVSDSDIVEIVDPALVFPEYDAVDFKNRDVYFKFVSENPEDMVIAQIEITWPNDVNGALTRIDLGKNTIWSGSEAGPTAIIYEADFTGSEVDRTLEALQKEKLRFTFENKPVADPDLVKYVFVVTFADGTDVSITTPYP